jgi:hypothetical protein
MQQSSGGAVESRHHRRRRGSNQRKIKPGLKQNLDAIATVVSRGDGSALALLQIAAAN